MDCNAANYTLMAINLLHVNMTALLTLWVDGDESTYQRQKETLFQIIDEHGTTHIDGVSVGNEVLFRNKSAEPDLIQKMTALREEFRSRQIYLDITTTDLANLLDPKIILAEDVVMANIHPYFGGVPIEDATNWTMTFGEQQLFKPARLARKSIAAIAEVGWPSRGVANSDSVPSLTNLQTFVDDFVCHANKANVKYYFFEAFDEPWKSKENELEGSWGIMDENRNLKVRIPAC
jgi:exo-beta-1,3-glucanase (GH17 family)